jgi:hypothetical protein
MDGRIARDDAKHSAKDRSPLSRNFDDRTPDRRDVDALDSPARTGV